MTIGEAEGARGSAPAAPPRGLRSSTSRCSSPAERRHRGQDDEQAEEGRDAETVGEHEQREGGEDGEAAMGEVDDAASR